VIRANVVTFHHSQSQTHSLMSMTKESIVMLKLSFQLVIRQCWVHVIKWKVMIILIVDINRISVRMEGVESDSRIGVIQGMKT